MAALTLGLAACGGTGTSTSAGHAAAGTPTRARSRPTRVYRVVLSGRAVPTRGAPQGRGFAVIAFHGQSRLCWRFAHLHGFTGATGAHILAGGKPRSGSPVVSLTSGSRLHHEGCVPIRPATTSAIWHAPAGYSVNIVSAQYPQGAVRGQL